MDSESPSNTGRLMERALNVGVVLAGALLMAGYRIRAAFFAPTSVEPGVLTHLEDWRTFQEAGIRVGAAGAPLTIVEFIDVQCPICARAAPWMVQHVEDPEATVVFRHYPRDSLSFEGAVALECAHADGRFAEMWTTVLSHRNELGERSWLELAVSAGVQNVGRFRRCMSGNPARARVRTDAAAAAELGIPGTPTFIINDMMIAGFGSPAYMDRIVDEATAERVVR